MVTHSIVSTFSQQILFKALEQAFQDFQGLDQRLILAFSGGRDSTALLDLLIQWCLESQPSWSLIAWHVNHQLQPQAAQWAEHCRTFCQARDIEYRESVLQLTRSAGESLEALARRARYEAFSAALSPGDVLLTAHHAQDNVETFLHRACRGAGIKGLGAIRKGPQALGAGGLLRPLLHVWPQTLQTYAAERGLVWIEDPSNQDRRWSRNYLRHSVLPLLSRHYPGVLACLDRASQHAQEAQTLLDELALADLEPIQQETRYGRILLQRPLLALSRPRQKNVLRAWIQAHGAPMPPALRLADFCRQLSEAKPDKHPELLLEGAKIRTYRQALYFWVPLPKGVPCLEGPWDPQMPLETPLGQMRWPTAVPKPSGEVHVSYRKGGECLKEGGSLKEYFQKAGVPPWLRSFIPLIYINKELSLVFN